MTEVEGNGVPLTPVCCGWGMAGRADGGVDWWSEWFTSLPVWLRPTHAPNDINRRATHLTMDTL